MSFKIPGGRYQNIGNVISWIWCKQCLGTSVIFLLFQLLVLPWELWFHITDRLQPRTWIIEKNTLQMADLFLFYIYWRYGPVWLFCFIWYSMIILNIIMYGAILQYTSHFIIRYHVSGKARKDHFYYGYSGIQSSDYLLSGKVKIGNQPLWSPYLWFRSFLFPWF